MSHYLRSWPGQAAPPTRCWFSRQWKGSCNEAHRMCLWWLYDQTSLNFSLITFTGCRRDKDGYYWITGRIDDMLNVSGKPNWVFRSEICSCLLNMKRFVPAWEIIFYRTYKRVMDGTRGRLSLLTRNLPSSPAGHLLSTAEVESALVEHEAVAEAAVVGKPHPVKGESLYCFVTLGEGMTYSHKLEAALRKQGGCILIGYQAGCLFWE